MKQFSADVKHSILLEYRPHTTTHSFSALAARHNIGGGERTVRNWFKRWNGIVESLKHKKGYGRPRALTLTHSKQYILTPVIKANRKHHAIHYTQLIAPLQQKLKKKVSIRTIRRYGKEMHQIKGNRTNIRTPWECKYTHIILLHLHCADLMY
jgi:transposase